jgi:NADPH-dependent curcumin reductase CurA
VAAARKRVFALHAEGKLQAWIDPQEFNGLGAVPDAIEHMLSGRSIGKVVVRMHE